MNERPLKPGWQVWRFEQMAQEVKDKIDRPVESGLERYVGLEHLDTGSLKIWRWGSTTDVEKSKLLFKKGDIIFGRRNAYLRRVAVADFDGVCSAHAMVLRAREAVVLQEFLPFFMQTDTFWEVALKVSAGSMSPTINWSNIAKEEFALPPLAEQRRMANMLWSLQHLEESYHNAHQYAKKLSASRITHFLAGYSYEKYARFVSQLLTESPRNGYSPKTSDSDRGFRTVSISAISDGHFTAEGNVKYADVSSEIVKRFFVQENDVFVVRGNGNLYLTGKAGIANQSYDDLFYPDLLIRLRFDQTKIHPRFAVFQWNSSLVHRNLISRAKSTNGIWKINGQDIREHMLIVPPLSEQLNLVDELGEIESAFGNLDSRLAKVGTMKNIVLNQYLQDRL